MENTDGYGLVKRFLIILGAVFVCGLLFAAVSCSHQPTEHEQATTAVNDYVTLFKSGNAIDAVSEIDTDGELTGEEKAQVASFWMGHSSFWVDKAVFSDEGYQALVQVKAPSLVDADAQARASAKTSGENYFKALCEVLDELEAYPQEIVVKVVETDGRFSVDDVSVHAFRERIIGFESV